MSREPIDPGSLAQFKRRYRSRVWYAALTSIVALGCVPSTADVERMVAVDDDAFARAYLDTLFGRRYDRVIARVIPGLPDSGLTESLAKVRDELPANPKRPMLIGVEQGQFDSVRATVLIYEVHGQSEFAVARVVIAQELGLRYLSGLHAERLRAPFAQTNALTLAGKGPGHFIVLAIAGAALLFSFFTAFYVLDTRMPRRWMWAPLALIGSSQVVFNWSTGAVGFTWFALRIPVLGMGRLGPVGPWLLVVAIPAGALIAFEHARRYRSERRTADAR